jgi:uncharacterized protein
MHRTEAVGDTRLHVLDVLRGIALLGMFLVHFHNYASGGGWLNDVYGRIVTLFFEERFWAIFGMLFGVGFAIQFRRADARGGAYLSKYLRRLAALAVFGFIAHGVFGYNVLLGYAIWGLALPIVRKWSTPALIGALLLSAVSGNIYFLARASYVAAIHGDEGLQRELGRVAAENRAFVQANNAAQQSTEFTQVVAARLQRMPWFYLQWYSFLPVNTFTLFLLGVLGLRLGLFDEPDRHRRLIVALMVFGLGAWIFETWVPRRMPVEGEPFLREMLLSQLASGFGLVRGMWLAFTYIGVVLLLVAQDPAWVRRLAVFGWPGRTALTSYMSQIILLDLTFAKYALGASVTPLGSLAAGIALFLANVAFSRWWLRDHPYGPLEWLWRSATYARWQPWRHADYAEVSDRKLGISQSTD